MRWMIFVYLVGCASTEEGTPPAIDATTLGAKDATSLADASPQEDAGFADATVDVDASTEADASTDSDGGMLSEHDRIRMLAEAYKAAHPGGDWDINAKTPAELANDPAARELLDVCGADRRPVFPILAWEYGGSDHPWINPDASALCYCVYIPVDPSTDHWTYDAPTDHVTADVYVLFPDDNPCKDMIGRDQVAGCIGDPTNFEILVDTASLHDGNDVGLNLAESSTLLQLILTDGTKVTLVENL